MVWRGDQAPSEGRCPHVLLGEARPANRAAGQTALHVSLPEHLMSTGKSSAPCAPGGYSWMQPLELPQFP